MIGGMGGDCICIMIDTGNNLCTLLTIETSGVNSC